VVRAVKNFANPELTNPSIVFVAHSKGLSGSAPGSPDTPPSLGGGVGE
jgi:hypothetical protein